jgi:hypothetical protein
MIDRTGQQHSTAIDLLERWGNFLSNKIGKNLNYFRQISASRSYLLNNIIRIFQEIEKMLYNSPNTLLWWY